MSHPGGFGLVTQLESTVETTLSPTPETPAESTVNVLLDAAGEVTLVDEPVTDGSLGALAYDLTGDGGPDLLVTDLDRDGRREAQVLDLDGDGIADTVLADTDGDSVPDQATVVYGGPDFVSEDLTLPDDSAVPYDLGESAPSADPGGEPDSHDA